MENFWRGFEKKAQETINQLIGNPFGSTPPKPPTPPPPPANVATGQTLGQRIGYPGS